MLKSKNVLHFGFECRSHGTTDLGFSPHATAGLTLHSLLCSRLLFYRYATSLCSLLRNGAGPVWMVARGLHREPLLPAA